MENLNSQLKAINTVAISGHIRPDGDCVGSCLGVYNYLVENYKELEVDIFLEEIPEVFRFLKNADKIDSTYASDKKYDLFIALDCGDKERLGKAVKYFDTAARTICIDHHISNVGFANINNIVPNASSTSELVFEVMDEEKISLEIAECLYTGIVHDTGVFQYSNTSQKTMNIAGSLMSKGIPFSKIIDETFYEKTYVQNQVLGRALLESVQLLNGQVIATAVRKSDMDFYGATSKDFDGIVNQLRITKGVECAIFMYEIGNHEYKVSMRSSDKVNVSEIATYFGGGGHVKAAGCTMSGTVYDVINNLTLHIEKQLKEME